MLKQRFLTALVLLPVCIAVVLLTPYPVFSFLFGVVVLGAAWEWALLLKASLFQRMFFVFGVALSLFLAYSYPVSWRPLCFAAVLFWLLALHWVMRYPQSKKIWYRPWVMWLLGFCVLVPAWTALILMRYEIEQGYWVLYAMSIVWIADTAAYFSGKAFGRQKLAPLVSPGKSVAGVVGGVTAVTTVSLVLSAAVHLESITAVWLAVATGAAALFSVLGDLFESMVKRTVGVKDSGQWLPGHGGLLDRVDALTSAMPFFTVIYIGFLSGHL